MPDLDAFDVTPAGRAGLERSAVEMPAVEVSARERLEALTERAADLQARSISDRTWEMYSGDWAQFERWCEMARRPSCPASTETVSLYLADLASQLREDGRARYKPSSITRKLAGVCTIHRRAGHPSPGDSPQVRQVMAGIRNTGDATVRRMRPLVTEDVRQVIDAAASSTWPGGVKAARDVCAFLFGFAGALRVSSVAALSGGDVELHPDGLHLRLRSSKTDQAGAGHTIALPFGRAASTCPVCAWRRWTRILAASRISRHAAMREVLAAPVGHLCRAELPEVPPLDGGDALFVSVSRSGVLGPSAVSEDALYRALKTRMSKAGLDPDGFGFHSLRAGFVTQARRNGASSRAVRMQTLHSSDAMVDVYDREWNPLLGNAVTELGL